jgi:Sedlin, N-terminal conserved region
MVVVFAIIGKSEPLYEAEIVPAGPGEEELAYLHQFILHASLDMVQSAMWSNNATLVSRMSFIINFMTDILDWVITLLDIQITFLCNRFCTTDFFESWIGSIRYLFQLSLLLVALSCFCYTMEELRKKVYGLFSPKQANFTRNTL